MTEKKYTVKEKDLITKILTNQKTLLPEEFSSMNEMASLYRGKSIEKSAVDLTHWDLIPYEQDIYGLGARAFGFLNHKNDVIIGWPNGALERYNLDTKQLVCSYPGLSDSQSRFVDIIISRNDKYMIYSCAAEYRDKPVIVQNLESPEDRYPLNIREGFPAQLLVSNDFNHVLVRMTNQKSSYVLHYEASTKAITHCRLKPTCIALSNDNKVICGESTSISVYHLESLVEEDRLYYFDSVHRGEITALAVSEDNRFFVSGSYFSMKIFSLRAYEELHHFQNIHSGWVNSISISRDCKFIVSASNDTSIKVFDISTKREVHVFPKVLRTASNENEFPRTKMIVPVKSVGRYATLPVKMSSDDRYICCSSNEDSFKVFEIANSRKLDSFSSLSHEESKVVIITNDNQSLIIGTASGSLKVFNLQSKELCFSLENVHKGGVSSLTFANHKKLLISGGEDGSIKISNYEMKDEAYQLSIPQLEAVHQGPICSLVVSKDERYLYSASKDKSIKKFDLETFKQLTHVFDIHNNSIVSLALSVDGDYLVSGSLDRSIKVFFTPTMQELFCFKEAHQSGITAVTLSSDGKIIATGSLDKSIKLFDFHTRQEIVHYANAHKEEITSLTISDDNKFLVSGSDDKTVKVFDLQTRTELFHYTDISEDEIINVSVLNDNRAILATAKNGSVNTLVIPFSDSNNLVTISPCIPAFTKFPNYANIFSDKSNLKNWISFLKASQDLYSSPYNWNVLHLLAINSPEYIPSIASYSTFKVPFLLDKFGKTPLHYVVAANQVNYLAANTLFEYIVEYLEDARHNLYERQNILISLSPLFPFIVSKMTSNHTYRYLDFCLQESPAPYNQSRPHFGLPETECAFTVTPVLLDENRDQIYEQGDEQITFMSTMVSLDYEPHSEDMHNSALALSQLKDEKIFKSQIVSTLIDHLWIKTLPVMVINGLLFSALMIMISVYIGLGERILALEIVIMVFTALFLSNELLQIVSLKSRYLKNVWNWVDLLYLMLVPAFIITRFTDSENLVAKSWMSSMIIIIGYMRWISYLRLFSPTRNLIQVILSILYDILGFLSILGFITIGFSLIFLEFNRSYAVDEGSALAYPYHLYATYKLIYGDTDDSEYSFSQKLLLAVILFLFNVLLLNLLISIMSGTYGRVQESAVLTDSLTRLDMIIEAQTFLRAIRRKRDQLKGFLIYCGPHSERKETEEHEVPEQKYGQQLREGMNEIAEKVEILSNKFEEVTSNIYELSASKELTKELQDLKDKAMSNWMKYSMDGMVKKWNVLKETIIPPVIEEGEQEYTEE